MDRILSKKKVADYLQGLVTKSADLAEYAGTDPNQLDDIADRHAGPAGNILNFYGYRWKLSGNNQRTFNVRTIHFAILIPGVNLEDYAAQDEAITLAEAIGLEVLSRIYQESQLDGVGWLYQNVIKDSILGEEIRPEKADGFVGMDFSFDLKVAEPLVVDKTKWSDGSIFCG